MSHFLQETSSTLLDAVTQHFLQVSLYYWIKSKHQLYTVLNIAHFVLTKPENKRPLRLVCGIWKT